MQVLEEDKAYAAGFFDGEGSVGISYNRGTNFQLRVRIPQKYKSFPLHFIKDRWAGNVRKRDKGTCLSWQASCRMALIFLYDVRPYLKVKKEQVELAIRFSELKQTNAHKPKSAKQIAEFFRIQLAIRKCNKTYDWS